MDGSIYGWSYPRTGTKHRRTDASLRNVQFSSFRGEKRMTPRFPGLPHQHLGLIMLFMAIGLCWQSSVHIWSVAWAILSKWVVAIRITFLCLSRLSHNPFLCRAHLILSALRYIQFHISSFFWLMKWVPWAFPGSSSRLWLLGLARWGNTVIQLSVSL